MIQLEPDLDWIEVKILGIKFLDRNFQIDLLINNLLARKLMIEVLGDRIMQKFNEGVPFLSTYDLNLLHIGKSTEASIQKNGIVVLVEILENYSADGDPDQNTEILYRAIDSGIVTTCQIGFEEGMPQVILPGSYYAKEDVEDV